jgi:tetratricopeptide (TPR) repeat protein
MTAQAYKLVSTAKPSTEQENLDVTEHALKCLSNLAICYLKEREFKRAVDTSDILVQLDPNHLKGLYRRAMARFELKDFEGAKADLTAALEIDPGLKGFAALTRQSSRTSAS